MELNILNYRVQICCIKKTELVKCMHVIVKHGLLNAERKQFFSLTETCEDYSVLVEEHVFRELQTCVVDLRHEGVWVPMSVSLSAYSAAKMAGIANTLIIPLADAGITIYNLSSYQTDFILVREADLTRAVDCLSSRMRTCSHSYGETLPLDRVKFDPSPDLTSHQVRPITHEFHTFTDLFHITSIDPDGLQAIGLLLIEIMFYPDRNIVPNEDGERFFSFTIVDKHVSLVMDDSTFNRFPPNTVYDDDEGWRMLKIHDKENKGLGFVECGIVAQISDPITAANISEYYISTYHYDHTLIPAMSLDEVTAMLHSRQQLTQQLTGTAR